jgi:hypothetical protein
MLGGDDVNQFDEAHQLLRSLGLPPPFPPPPAPLAEEGEIPF